MSTSGSQDSSSKKKLLKNLDIDAIALVRADGKTPVNDDARIEVVKAQDAPTQEPDEGLVRRVMKALRLVKADGNADYSYSHYHGAVEHTHPVQMTDDDGTYMGDSDHTHCPQCGSDDRICGHISKASDATPPAGSAATESPPEDTDDMNPEQITKAISDGLVAGFAALQESLSATVTAQVTAAVEPIQKAIDDARMQNEAIAKAADEAKATAERVEKATQDAAIDAARAQKPAPVLDSTANPIDRIEKAKATEKTAEDIASMSFGDRLRYVLNS